MEFNSGFKGLKDTNVAARGMIRTHITWEQRLPSSRVIEHSEGGTRSYLMMRPSYVHACWTREECDQLIAVVNGACCDGVSIKHDEYGSEGKGRRIRKSGTRGAQMLGVSPPGGWIFVRCRLIFVGPHFGSCFMSAFLRLKFCGGF